jgi:hypothetical protein
MKGGIRQEQIKFWHNEPDFRHSQVRVLIYNGQVRALTKPLLVLHHLLTVGSYTLSVRDPEGHIETGFLVVFP